MAREFWINTNRKGYTILSEKPESKIVLDEFTHVIEKSAYDYYEGHAEMFKAEWEKTKDKLDKAIEALKEVQTRSAHMESKHAGKINRYVTEFLRKLGEI